ncbi:c-type cytochrome [Marinivivus vitaminiproducens]|uniref:c-type cytochrome n=1 Tax=Marinivivus vitaminiproducens TaxID=3035935 RepID=UPI00279F9E8F|nr:c-type cytochrome [Geminicoccaceae bacterium SCSIO 64248]
MISAAAGFTLAVGTFVPAAGQSVEETYRDVCAGCHGETGTSEMEGIPSLGGQPAMATAMQLFLFREGRRPDSPMTPIAQDLSNNDLRSFSSLIEKLPPPEPLAEGRDDPAYARGKASAAKHVCRSCHEADYSGRQQMPRLAGQREEYIKMALAQYKSGERVGSSAAMNELMADISEAEIDDLAYFLARFGG